MLPFIVHANKQLILEQAKNQSPGRPCFGLHVVPACVWRVLPAIILYWAAHRTAEENTRGELVVKDHHSVTCFESYMAVCWAFVCLWFECQIKVITCCQAGRNESHMAQSVHIWPSSLRGARQLAFMCSCNCSFRASVGLGAALQDESSKTLSAFMEKLKLHSYRERTCGIACTRREYELFIVRHKMLDTSTSPAYTDHKRLTAFCLWYVAEQHPVVVSV